MAVEVIMPQMGESIFEGTITKWLKKPGDSIDRDEPLFEISTPIPRRMSRSCAAAGGRSAAAPTCTNASFVQGKNSNGLAARKAMAPTPAIC